MATVTFTALDLRRTRAHDHLDFLCALRLEQWRARPMRLGLAFWHAHLGKRLWWLSYVETDWRDAWLAYFTACATGEEPETTPDAPDFTADDCRYLAALYRRNIH